MGAPIGCASGYSASHPLYDFDSVFLNGDMRGQQPWKAPDRAALREALDAPRGTLEASTRPDDVPRTRHTLSPKGRASTVVERQRDRQLPNHIPAQMAELSKGEFDDTRPPKRLSGLILGDGSLRGEVSAAASRLIGMGPAISPVAFAQHLERSAALNFPRSDMHGGGVLAIWEGLRAKGLTFGQQDRQPRTGDLVFFNGVADVDGDGRADAVSGIGVVSERVDDDTIVCIAPVMNAVRPIFLSPSEPNVRRQGGQTMNTPIRARHRDEGANASTLAVQLLVGFARI